MEQGKEDLENVDAGQYGFVRLPSVVDGHQTFILEALVHRYVERMGKYVLIFHRMQNEHYILGVYDDLREALQTRYVTNFVLFGGHKFDNNHFMEVHDIEGPVVYDKAYDPAANEVKDFARPEEDEATS